MRPQTYRLIDMNYNMVCQSIFVTKNNIDMLITGTAIAAGVSAGAQIFGGIMKSRAARKSAREQSREIANQKAQNEAYYNRYYNADATQFADNQRTLEQARAALRRNNQAAAGQAAVMGSTNATAAATKEANNQAMANAASAVSANAQQYKTHVQDSYRAQDANLSVRKQNLTQAREEANAAAITDAVNGVNTIAESYIKSDRNDEFHIGK